MLETKIENLTKAVIKLTEVLEAKNLQLELPLESVAADVEQEVAPEPKPKAKPKSRAKAKPKAEVVEEVKPAVDDQPETEVVGESEPKKVEEAVEEKVEELSEEQLTMPTYDDIKKMCMLKSSEGKKDEAKAVLKAHGATLVKDLDANILDVVMSELEVL